MKKIAATEPPTSVWNRSFCPTNACLARRHRRAVAL